MDWSGMARSVLMERNMSKPTELGPEITNGGALGVDLQIPYIAQIEIEGVADILMHRWNCESIESKSKAAKGSAEKKTDNLESFVYRDRDGFLGCPGEYFRQAIIGAAKFRADPRSPRKSAMDLFKAGIVSLTDVCPFGPNKTKAWHYEHKCRVQVQRNGVTRTRPAFKAGWKLNFSIMVNLPEYIDKAILHEVVSNAGRLIGIADFRPTYGRFVVTKFEVGN
jgi:hypothetical protein